MVRWRLFLPYLHLRIFIPFITVWTSILYRMEERFAVEYVALYIKLLKWEFNFSLYDTMQRKVLRAKARKKEKDNT